MPSLNRVMLMGHLGKDPEIRTAQNGVNVASFSLATSQSYNDKKTGDKQKKVQWHRIVAFDSLADICRFYVKKGDPLYVEGEINYSSYEKNGGTIYTTEIIAKSIQLLKSRENQNTETKDFEESGPLPF